MKKLFILIVVAAFYFSVFAQPPERLSYQVVIRNNSGQLVANHSVGMKISILEGSPTGTAVYVETHIPTTNANGLATLEIGGGATVTGTFAAINWSTSNYYLKTETDPAGGTSYTIAGTSQLVSVPYALNSKTANSIADNSVNSAKISDGSIVTADLADNTVSTAKLGNLAVSADKIQNTAVTTDKLANGSVTGVKIAQAGATNGQVLKWNTSTWVPGADLTGECLWSQSGSDIYFTGGKVGIGGTNLGNAWFQVKAGANSEIARFESTAASNWIGMYTSGVRKGILWVNGDNITLSSNSGEVKICTEINMERLAVEADGDVTTPTTGSNFHLLPVAYGYVNQMGVLQTTKSTINVASERSAAPYKYTVAISDIPGNFIALVTGSSVYKCYPLVSYVSNTFIVDFVDKDGNGGQVNNFSFVVFAP